MAEGIFKGIEYEENKILITNYVNITKSISSVESSKMIAFDDIKFMVAKELDHKSYSVKTKDSRM